MALPAEEEYTEALVEEERINLERSFRVFENEGANDARVRVTQRLRAHTDALTGEFNLLKEVRKFFAAELSDPGHRTDLEVWAHELVLEHLHHEARTMALRARTKARRVARGKRVRSVFSDVEEQQRRGTPPAVIRANVFERCNFVVDDNHNRKKLGEMTRQDHLFVANGYLKRSVGEKIKASLHFQLARRFKNDTQTTRDVLTEDEYMKILGDSEVRNDEIIANGEATDYVGGFKI